MLSTLKTRPWWFYLSITACALAFAVVVLGAYVRLSHAGLGCPDWPGCYGKLTVPSSQADISQANAEYPQRPVESVKAWKEMLHRYLAGILVLLIITLTIIAWRKRPPDMGVTLPTGILILVFMQALLGMWTVTLLLKPLVVSLHLLGGMTCLTLLLWLSLRTSAWTPQLADSYHTQLSSASRWSIIALVVLSIQIALGGWTSSNYAALACYGFPQCNQQWWPTMAFGDAFILWRGLGIDYEGGVLDHPARVAIHMTHRLSAVVVLAVFALFILRLYRLGADYRKIGLIIALLLLLQITLGVANVTLGLPLVVATAHNAVAALLLLATVTAIYIIRSPQSLSLLKTTAEQL